MYNPLSQGVYSGQACKRENKTFKNRLRKESLRLNDKEKKDRCGSRTRKVKCH